MLGYLERFYGRFSTHGSVYNCRRPSDFLPGLKAPLIMSAGRLWDEAKNISILNAIAADLPWPVYIAGERKHPEGGRCAFGGLRMLGKLSTKRLALWLGRTSIYVLPAKYEPFGLSALEAALAGCALVMGDIPTLREVWGDAGVYVHPDRPDLLLDALLALIRHPEEIPILAAKARARALQFNPERMAREYMGMYRVMIARRSGEEREHAAMPAFKGETARIDNPM
jgi:glycosyltransferase involved in cell wall biosynthesis